MSDLSNNVNILMAQQQELLMVVREIQEQLVSQKNKEVLERLTALERICKDQSIKIDCLGGVVDIRPDTAITPATPVERPKKNMSVSDYFKELWATNKEMIFKHGAITRDECDRIMQENAAAIEKKAGDDRAIAQIIWTKYFRGSLNPAGKAIIESLKNQSKNDANRANTLEVNE